MESSRGAVAINDTSIFLCNLCCTNRAAPIGCREPEGADTPPHPPFGYSTGNRVDFWMRTFMSRIGDGWTSETDVAKMADL